MKGLETSTLRSRVKGRRALEKSLRALHRRVYHFATCRQLSPEDHQWALEVASALQELLHRVQRLDKGGLI